MPPELEELAPNSFIFTARGALPEAFCANVIERFENAEDEQYQGRVGQTVEQNLDIKRSTDLVVSGKQHWQDVDKTLFGSLAEVMKYLREHHSFFRGRFKDFGYAIQRTLPGEFFHWHVDSGSHSFSDRQLVALWYLNDVEGPGGETEFRVQKVKVRPETGKLLIFPPFWTHEHRGVTLERGRKYIATTWLMFA